MTSIKTNGITILLVEVPEDATRFVTDWKFLIVDIFSPTQKMIPIPEGQYQILGKSTELSEEQMKEILPIYEGAIRGYRIYTQRPDLLTKDIQESYLSLLEANGIVDRNPISDEQKNVDRFWQVEWQEAQSKVKHYLVLKKNV